MLRPQRRPVLLIQAFLPVAQLPGNGDLRRRNSLSTRHHLSTRRHHSSRLRSGVATSNRRHQLPHLLRPGARHHHHPPSHQQSHRVTNKALLRD